eukprot:1159572-Pelagomonas_calceolata.AAC.2
MGPSASDTEKESVHDKLMSLFAKAGYEVGMLHLVFSRRSCEGEHRHMQPQEAIALLSNLA